MSWSHSPPQPRYIVGRLKPKVVGLCPFDEQRLDVRVAFSGPVVPEWLQLFKKPEGYTLPNGMHEPILHGNTEVALTPLDTELEAYVQQFDARISATNAQYEKVFRPMLLERVREYEERERAKSDSERRMKEARERAEKL
jgi:hypothetical protein